MHLDPLPLLESVRLLPELARTEDLDDAVVRADEVWRTRGATRVTLERDGFELGLIYDGDGRKAGAVVTVWSPEAGPVADDVRALLATAGLTDLPADDETVARLPGVDLHVVTTRSGALHQVVVGATR